MNFLRHCWQHIGSDIIASVLFYTSIPISSAKILNFSGVARLAPLVGLMIGGIRATRCRNAACSRCASANC